MSTQKENLIYWLIFEENNLLILKETNLPPSDDLVKGLHLLRKLHLGKINNTEYHCGEISKGNLSSGMILVPLKQAFSLLDEHWFSIIVKAYSIINWDRNHQFCSRCGCTTVHQSELLFERVCTACQLVFYPRISPSIIVLIKKGAQILMARSPHFAPGVYGLIAGFVEPGESIEEAVHREVKEEVGIEIKNLRYFGSQPWPFPDALMVGFIADYTSGELSINNQEIETAGWYKYDELPGRPSMSISIASKLLEHFIREHTDKR